MDLNCNFQYIFTIKFNSTFLSFFSSGGQPSNGQTVGDLMQTPSATNGHPASHGTPPGGAHHIQTLGVHRMPMMSLPPGMQFRPQFGHPHGPGGPQFFSHGPIPGMHNDR